MTTHEFLCEVAQSEQKPADFDAMYAEFRDYQQMAAGALQELHRICEKYGIRYRLTFGSLLGAIRDNGQIPWDYDIDVFVAHEDRAALIAALNEDLSPEYYYDSYENHPNVCNNLTRITPKGYRSTELHVDIFYFTGTSRDPEQRKADAARLSRIQRIRYDKLVNPFQMTYGKPKRFLILSLRKLKWLFVPKKKLLAEYNRLVSQYSSDHSEYVINTGMSAAKRYYKTEDMVNVVLWETEMGSFYVPAGYENILTMIYGDYRKIYPLESRLKELNGCYRKLKRYASCKGHGRGR